MTNLARTSDVLQDITASIVGNVSAIPYTQALQLPAKYGKGDEEELVVVVSDLQIGHRSPTTDAKTIAKRMENLTRRVLKITALHRRAYPVRKCHVFLLGDIIHGERVGKTVNLDELEIVMSEQMFGVAVPTIEKLLLTLERHFESVDVWTVVGNHGRLSKENADTSNMDGIVYRFLIERTRNFPTIRWHTVYDRFYQMAEVAGHRFLLIHGDQIKMTLTLPFYGVTTRAMRLAGSVGKFDYLVLGHFHTANFLTWQDTEIVMNGTFVSDDQWVLQKLGMSTSPKQVVFGVHPTQGMTFRYLVKLD